jgi:hypothetical protein
MIAGLEALKSFQFATSSDKDALAAMKISTKKQP